MDIFLANWGNLLTLEEAYFSLTQVGIPLKKADENRCHIFFMDSGTGNMAEAFQSAATQVAVNYFYSPYLFNKIICKNMGWSGGK